MGAKSLGRTLLATIFAAAVLMMPAPLSDTDAHAAYPQDIPEMDSDTITSIFNQHALDSDMALSCEDKTNMRSGQIETPLPRNTEIQGKLSSSSLAQPAVLHRSPRLSDENRAQVEAIMDSIPDHLEDLLFINGGTWVFTEHTLVEALPEYDDHSKTDPDTGEVSYPFYEDYVGLYIHGEKRLYVTFNLADVGVFKNDNQIIKSIGYRPVRHDVISTAHHEFGHFINYVLAERYMSLTDAEGQPAKRLSDSERFDDAYQADVKDLLQTIQDEPEFDTSRLSYYLTQNFEGTALGGDHETISNARSEAMAELWSEITGHGDKNIKEIFPRAYKILEEIDLALMRAYEENGQSCILTKSGIAFDVPSI